MYRRAASVGAGLLRPVDGASLRVFGRLFGVVMAASTLRFVAKGWVHAQLLEPSYHFTYPGFAFVRPLPAPLLYGLFALLTAAAFGLAFGLRPRSCALVFGLGFSYVELIDQTRYLNHYYLASLLAFMLVLLPAGKTVPALYLYVLRFQVAVVYVFAGVAKLNHEWLVDAQPLRLWLAARADLPLVGPLLARPLTAHILSFAGAAFDLTVVFFLLAPRTRPFAFVVAIAFHALTGLLFPIGIFPWLMTVCLTLFLDPDWPKVVARSVEPRTRTQAHARVVPAPIVALLGVHCALQLAVPLHQHFAADSAWTYRGFDFAWRVMAAEKSGAVLYEAVDPATGARTWVEPRVYLTADQELAFARDPALIWALGQHVALDLTRREGRAAPLFVHAFASLNGQPSRRLVDPSVPISRGEPPAGWVLSRAP